MRWGRTLPFALLICAGAALALPAAPAAASHDIDELKITVALNAAGDDKISVADLNAEPDRGYLGLASDVAISLDRPPGSFRTSKDVDSGYVHPDAKLIQPDRSGGLSYAFDTAKLQLLAQKEGYGAVIIVVCTPRVHQVFKALVAPARAPFALPGSQCRGWYQEVDDPPIRAVVHLQPDRARYSSAVVRVVGGAAITLALLGLGATLLRRGPLPRRSLASWLLSVGAAVVVAGMGWSVVSVVLWIRGPAADAMLLGGGGRGEQVARTLLPGLVFVVPALLPAAILLSAARKEETPPVGAVPAGPPVPMWWPTVWWGQWAEQAASPPGGSSGWTPPGDGHG